MTLWSRGAVSCLSLPFPIVLLEVWMEVVADVIGFIYQTPFRIFYMSDYKHNNDDGAAPKSNGKSERRSKWNRSSKNKQERSDKKSKSKDKSNQKRKRKNDAVVQQLVDENARLVVESEEEVPLTFDNFDEKEYGIRVSVPELVRQSNYVWEIERESVFIHGDAKDFFANQWYPMLREDERVSIYTRDKVFHLVHVNDFKPNKNVVWGYGNITGIIDSVDYMETVVNAYMFKIDNGPTGFSTDRLHRYMLPYLKKNFSYAGDMDLWLTNYLESSEFLDAADRYFATRRLNRPQKMRALRNARMARQGVGRSFMFDGFIYLLRQFLPIIVMTFPWAIDYFMTYLREEYDLVAQDYQFRRDELDLFLLAMYNEGVFGTRADMKPYAVASWIGMVRSCVGEFKPIEMFKDCSLSFRHSIDACGRKAVQVYGCIIEGAQTVIPMKCDHNLAAAFQIRVMGPREYDEQYVREFCRFFKQWCTDEFGVLVVEEYSFWDWVKPFGKKLRYSLQRIQELYDSGGELDLYDLNVSAFVKDEVYVGKSHCAFKPRMIIMRCASFLWMFGGYFYGVSKALAHHFDFNSENFYVNATTATQLGEYHARGLSYKHVVEFDVSNWDGSLLKEYILLEKWFITNILDRLPEHWDSVKDNWTITNGRSRNLKFRYDHGRRSGDLWTSCFNSLLNIAFMRFMVGKEGIMMVLGDDNLCYLDGDIDQERLFDNYKRLGLKCEIRVDPAHPEFCSGLFYPLGGGYKWGVKAGKILSKFGVNYRNHSEKFHKRMLKGTAQSMLCIARHIPILGVILERICDNDLVGILPDHGINPHKPTDIAVDLPDAATYQWFADRYGFSVDDVLLLEEELSNLTIDDFPLVWTHPMIKQLFSVDVAEINYETINEFSNSVEIVPRPASVFALISNRAWEVADYTAPFLEEFLKTLFPWFAFCFGLVESAFHRSAFHVHFHILCGALGFFRGTWLHLLYNGWCRGRIGLPEMILTVSHYMIFCLLESLGWGPVPLLLRIPFCFSMYLCHGRFFSLSILGANIFARHGVTYLGLCGKQWSWLLVLFCTLVSRARGDRVANNPASFLHIFTVMTKTKNKGHKNKATKKKKAAWRTAVSNVMKAGGSALGEYFGGPIGGTIGHALGTGLSKITGMGAYHIRGNSLANEQVTFGDGAIQVSHREYIGDILSSQEFSTLIYDINPGLSTTFPWLAVLAENYERYDIRGLAFEFVSTAGYLTTTQAQGVVVMATQYDPDSTDFVNRREMEAYMYTTSGVVTEPQLHLVECDPRDRPLGEMYIRYGATDEERFTDHGKLTVAVDGCPDDDQILGELWVTYDVMLLLPRLIAHGYATASWAHISNGPYDDNDALGTLQTTPQGVMAITVGLDSGKWRRICFPPLLDHGVYLIVGSWVGSSTSSCTATRNVVNAMKIDGFELHGENHVDNDGMTCTTFITVDIIRVNGRGAEISYVTTTLPSSGTSVDVYIAQIGDPTILSEVTSYEEALELRGSWITHPVVHTRAARYNFSRPNFPELEEEHKSDCDTEEEFQSWLAERRR